MRPGDLIGFKTPGFFAALIRFGQRLSGVLHEEITHIAVVVDDADDPEIVQSVRLVDSVRLSSYGKTPYIVIPFPGADANRADVVAFANSCVGRKYGVLSVISRGINCLTPKWWQFGCSRAGDMDCSTLGARSLEHGGVVIPWDDAFQVMPGQLADAYFKGN